MATKKPTKRRAQQAASEDPHISDDPEATAAAIRALYNERDPSKDRSFPVSAHRDESGGLVVEAWSVQELFNRIWGELPERLRMQLDERDREDALVAWRKLKAEERKHDVIRLLAEEIAERRGRSRLTSENAQGARLQVTKAQILDYKQATWDPEQAKRSATLRRGKREQVQQGKRPRGFIKAAAIVFEVSESTIRNRLKEPD